MTTSTITVLGSTGSIGTNTLDVLSRHPERFSVFALTASSQVDLMLEQCRRFSPRYAVMSQPSAAHDLSQLTKTEGLRVEVLCGEQALCDVSSHADVDMVMAAIVGAAGLPPSLAAARAGKRLLLANKEAIVVGGALFMQAVHQGGGRLLPIDSEHSAIFQSLPEDPATWSDRVSKIILTASGGPFRTRDPRSLSLVTPDQACAHPNWSMGRKISVDSATMMNKALEVIEAHHLFSVMPAHIEVVIHPQSVIHSMVEFRDRSVVAQLGTPDMRVPIAYGLSWPDRIESGAKCLDFAALSGLSFEAPDLQRFPGLGLAWQALAGPLGTTAVLNAANEVAVAAFLDQGLRFDRIHAVNEQTLANVVPSAILGVDDLMALDQAARRAAMACVAQWVN